MVDKSLTLLEVHLGDAQVQIGPKTLDIGSEQSESAASDPTNTDGDSSTSESGCSVYSTGALILLGAVLVGAVAALAWKLRSGGDLDAAESLDELAA